MNIFIGDMKMVDTVKRVACEFSSNSSVILSLIYFNSLLSKLKKL